MENIYFQPNKENSEFLAKLEKLDDDIRVEERFYVGGKPKKLRHFKGDNPTPLLEKEWYQNGQLKRESYFYDIESKAKKGELSKESKNYH